jgi:diphthamide biosynthesis methyltransferase
MVVTSNSKDYTVNVATNTSIVNDNWANTTLASFVVGNKVTAYGVVNDTTLSVAATVLRNESI